MDDKELKCAKIVSDIKEIDDALTSACFDRQKVEEIIRKHTVTDVTVAVINSPFTPGFTTFEQATDDMVKNNLLIIRQVLLGNLAKA